MSLNIKNEHVHELVREAARRTGQNQTSVVETALLNYLNELDREARLDLADEILRDMQQRVRELGGLPMDPDDLYDPVTGLPA